MRYIARRDALQVHFEREFSRGPALWAKLPEGFARKRRTKILYRNSKENAETEGEEKGPAEEEEEAGERRQDKDAQTRRNHETLRTGSRISRSIAVRLKDSLLSPSDTRNPGVDFANVSNRMVVSKRGRECFEDWAVEENIKIMV